MSIKIVVINQPIQNRGDQAAHKAFIELLKSQKFDITVIFFGKKDFYSSFFENIEGVKYLCVKGMIGENTLRFFLKSKFPKINLDTWMLPGLRIVSRIMRKADAIICAPGGVCMGAYQNWEHVWNLELALMSNKKVAIWGRSIGPFYNYTKTDEDFTRRSKSILRQVGFLSLRDWKSQKLAKELGCNHVAMIDSAFALMPKQSIPEELRYLETTDYVVFVPNKLYSWHPYYKNILPDKFDDLYVEILNFFIKSGKKVVMLPQLFDCGTDGDIFYFKQLREKALSSNNVIVIEEKYDCDIQQSIIKRSKMVIGARYHSIIFAINNMVPFVCLSYEHKMRETLQLLNLSDYSIDLDDIITNSNIVIVLDIINNILDNENAVHEILIDKNDMARSIVVNAFKELCDYIVS